MPPEFGQIFNALGSLSHKFTQGVGEHIFEKTAEGNVTLDDTVWGVVVVGLITVFVRWGAKKISEGGKGNPRFVDNHIEPEPVEDHMGWPFHLGKKAIELGERTRLYAAQDAVTNVLDKHIGGLESDD